MHFTLTTRTPEFRRNQLVIISSGDRHWLGAIAGLQRNVMPDHPDPLDPHVVDLLEGILRGEASAADLPAQVYQYPVQLLAEVINGNHAPVTDWPAPDATARPAEDSETVGLSLEVRPLVDGGTVATDEQIREVAAEVRNWWARRYGWGLVITTATGNRWVVPEPAVGGAA